jgi:hypothetical protein
MKKEEWSKAAVFTWIVGTSICGWAAYLDGGTKAALATVGVLLLCLAVGMAWAAL